MSRARLTQTPIDLVTDSGAVLLSIVKGEQLELPITLNFLADTSLKVSNNYIYEAVIVEANNVIGQTATPTELMPSAVKTTLTVRLPTYVGTWSSASAYNKDEVILYDGSYYKLISGSARTSATVPSSDALWEVTTLNTVYIQFPSTVANTWSIQPTVSSAVYGFIELRVTEPATSSFIRTWKPVRGVIEILFSPTDVVADV